MFVQFGLAQGTRTWEQTKYDEFEKGSAHGVAINSNGYLTLAPSFSSLNTTPSTYLWGLAADSRGNVYAAAGSPARVYRITPDGKASIIFAPQELQVQAIVADSGGAIYAATSPDGKVYKIVHGGPTPGKAAEGTHTTAEVAAAQEGAKPAPEGEKPRTSVAVDSSYSASVYFDPKTKYIWALALGTKQGQLYVDADDRGEIYRIDGNGSGTVFFKSDEAHIRVIDFDTAGNLIAGTDGSGLIYRISPQGEAFVLYSAPKKEITALAIDAQGDIYAAGAGEKRGASAPQPSPFGAQTILTAPTPGATPPGTAPGLPTGITAVPYQSAGNPGSEVYCISPDGSPRTIWSSRDDLVYALAFDPAGQLLAGTGNKGKIYLIHGSEYTDLVKASANQVTAFAPAPKGGLYAATSNLGKVFLLGPNSVSEGTYESDVFDARNFSRWGRVEVRGTGNFEIFARSGNVDNPDRNWSSWKKVDLQKNLPVDAPPARFIQWKAVLHSGNPAAAVDSLTLNYLPKNVAPQVDDVTVSIGSRVPLGTHIGGSGSAEASPFEPPVPTIHDRRYIAVKWKAHDDNDDTLVYSVYYRGEGESRWKLLRDDVDDRYVNLEADQFPDGAYTIRVVASDAPSHSPEDALTGERTSSRFEVDNTAPRIESLTAKAEGSKVRVSLRAVDNFSPIKHAEYSVDAGDWQLIEPVGQLSDSRIENYDFTVPIPAPASDTDSNAAAGAGNRDTEEHTIVIRVYDRFENVGVSQAVVKTVATK